MNNILIIVDMQNDFISGVLGTKQAQDIVEKIASLQTKYDTIIFTQDTHPLNYEETDEYKLVPTKHCIVDTDGWKIHNIFDTENHNIIQKNSFESEHLISYIKSLKDISSITLVGLCTDICVIENAKLLKKTFKNTPIIVLKDYCAGSTIEKHKQALEEMSKLGIQIKE